MIINQIAPSIFFQNKHKTVQSNPILQPLAFDTVSFTAKKKAKFFGKYDQNKVLKRFVKKGAPQQSMHSILDNPRKKQALANLIEDYEEGRIKFSRPPREREIALAIDNEFSYEQIQKFIDWQDNIKEKNAIFTRPLKTKEAIVAIKEGATEAQIQRALMLADKDKDGKSYLSRSLTFKEGLSFAQKNYTDEQIEIYLALGEAHIRPQSIVDNPKKYQKLLELTKNSCYSRNLSIAEAGGAIERNYTDKQIQKLIDLTDCGFQFEEQNDEATIYLTQRQLYTAVDFNLNKFQTYYFLKYDDKHNSFLNIAKNESLLKRFLNLIGELGDIQTTRALTFEEAVQIFNSKGNLSDEQIQTYIDLVDKNVPSHVTLSYITDFWNYKDTKDVDELSVKEKRELLKKILAQSEYFYNYSFDVDVFSLIPKNQEEYSIIIPKIASSIGMQSKELSQNDFKVFYSGLNSLIQKISNVDLNGDLNEIQSEIDDILVGIGELEKTFKDKKYAKENLKLLQQAVKSEEFQSLSKNDKNILTIAILLCNINKAQDDKICDDDCAFDAFYIIQKLNLDEVSQFKIYEIIKNQNWLEKFGEENLRKNIELKRYYIPYSLRSKNIEIPIMAQDIAFETRHGNTFELVKILSRVILENKNGDLSKFNSYCEEIEKYLAQIRKTQIFLPQAKIPKASKIKNGEVIEKDGIKNVVLDLNKCDFDLELYGFNKGIDKDNLYMLVHGLDSVNQLSNFSAFSIVDSEALLSSSYMNQANHRVFRRQGIVLDVCVDDIHAGYFRDFGSGNKKTLESIKRGCIFPLEGNIYKNQRSEVRTYIPNLIKEKLNLNDEEYVELIGKIRNMKSWREIQNFDCEVANTLKAIFDEMELGQRKYQREYNEILISRPKVQAVFSYGQEYENIPTFLKKYAMDNDLPIILLGD